jgi:hypothetical protein
MEGKLKLATGLNDGMLKNLFMDVRGEERARSMPGLWSPEESKPG